MRSAVDKQVLFLAHRIPYPPNKGDKIRSYHELKHLVEAGWAVHLCALADDPGDLGYVAELKRWCTTVTVEPISPRRQRIASARGPLKGQPISVPYFYHRRLQDRVDELLASHPIRAVFCFSGPMAEYLFRSRGLLQVSSDPSNSAARSSGAAGVSAGALASRPRLVMDLVDVDSDKWTQYSRFRRPPMSWVYRMEGALLARYERRLAEFFDAVALASAAEAEMFRRRSRVGRKVHALGNGVDLDYFHPVKESPGEETRLPRLVFCGAMDYFPNIDGVLWFARDVLPRVRRAAGDVGFTVVGSKPGPEVTALSGTEGVTVTGRVDDVRTYVWAADVSVAPIRIARGVQNKVLEAMAMGKPVVATPEAFEGIDAQPDKHLVVADANADVFAASVAGLLRDAERRSALGNSARLRVEERYRWDISMRALDRLLSPGDGERTWAAASLSGR